MPRAKKADVVVELYAPFARWRTDLLRVETRCFGPQGSPDEALEESVKGCLFLAVIRNGDTAFGYILMDRNWPDTAELSFAAVDPEYQGKGYYGIMMKAVEEELVRIGYSFINGDYRIENGFADAVLKHYGGRVVAQYDHPSRLGPLRFIRVAIGPEKSSTEGKPLAPSDSGALPDGSTGNIAVPAI